MQIIYRYAYVSGAHRFFGCINMGVKKIYIYIYKTWCISERPRFLRTGWWPWFGRPGIETKTELWEIGLCLRHRWLSLRKPTSVNPKLVLQPIGGINHIGNTVQCNSGKKQFWRANCKSNSTNETFFHCSMPRNQIEFAVSKVNALSNRLKPALHNACCVPPTH